jgi:hypothetical protein
MPSILHGVIREGQWPFSATGSGLLRPQVGTAFPPKRNYIVPQRFSLACLGFSFLFRGVQRGYFSFQRERSEIMKVD